MKVEDSTSWKEADDLRGKNNTGKSNIDDKEEKKGCSNMKLEPVTPELFDENCNTNKTEFPNLELNQLLQQKSKSSFQGSISWKAYLFPSLLRLATDSRKKQQYFGLNLVDEETEKTVWTHKASVWKDLIESVQEIAKTGHVVAINNMFNGIKACAVRAVPRGPNDTKTFKTGKGQNIQHWIMLVPMPADIDSSKYIPEFIRIFQVLSKKAFIRSAYQSGVMAITQHPGLMSQLSEEGNYWIAFDNASQKDVIFKCHNCLSEVLLDNTIKEVASLMFGVKKDPNTWTGSVITYAYGN